MLFVLGFLFFISIRFSDCSAFKWILVKQYVHQKTELLPYWLECGAYSLEINDWFITQGKVQGCIEETLLNRSISLPWTSLCLSKFAKVWFCFVFLIMLMFLLLFWSLGYTITISRWLSEGFCDICGKCDKSVLTLKFVSTICINFFISPSKTMNFFFYFI